MQCEVDTLSLYLDGELGVRARQALEQHLAACGDCRSLLDELRRNDRVLIQWGAAREPLPLTTEARVTSSLRPRTLRSRVLSASRMMPAAVGTTAAALLVVATTSLSPLLGTRPISSAAPSRAMAHLIAKQSAPLLDARRTSALLPGRNTTLSPAQPHRTIQLDIE